MRIRKVVVTAAGGNQSALPLQTLIDRDGAEKSVLRIIIEEALRAKIEEICLVISPTNETAYAQAAGDRAGMIRFVHQRESIGYGHALYCAKDFVKQEPFLHLVGDHLYVSKSDEGCAQRLVRVAEQQGCSVSSVQSTLESLLRNYGAVGGQRTGDQDLFVVDSVIEKPTPTEAEQKLIIPGMRAGHYLCFFGMHVLTPTIMEILGRRLEAEPRATLSSALAELAKQERYLALDTLNHRYDVGVKYGLLRAQLALALSGADREEVLAHLVEVVASRA